MITMLTGPPGGTVYLRPVVPYGQRALGKTPGLTFDAAGFVAADVEPGRPYRVVTYTAAGVVERIESARVWERGA
jgi:hypothetical protein